MAGTRKTVYRSPRVTVEYDIDSYKRGIARCAVGKELRFAVTGIVRRARTYAESIAPRSKRKRQPGEAKPYAESFYTRTDYVTLPPQWPMRRVVGELWNLAPHAVMVEVGTATSPKYRVLRRTLRNIQTHGLASHSNLPVGMVVPERPRGVIND